MARSIILAYKRQLPKLILLVGLLIAFMEVQKEVLLGLLEKGKLSQEIVLTIEGILFVSFGVFFHYLFRKYIRHSSFLHDLLSERELEIFHEIIKGKPNKEIAESLFIEKSTLKTHINHLYKKLDVRNRPDLIRYYSDV